MESIVLSKTAYYLTLSSERTYRVTSGKLFLYTVGLDSDGNPGRRFFMCELNEGDAFPAMYIKSEILGTWTFLISAAGDGVITESEEVDKNLILKFANKKLNLRLFSAEEFADEVVEKVNVTLIKEEAGIYAVTQEQEKSYEKGLTLIYNLRLQFV